VCCWPPPNHTLTAALRALELAQQPGFQNYHRLLNRARWSARQAAGVLLGLLVEAFVPSGPVILGLDDIQDLRTVTLERGVVLGNIGLFDHAYAEQTLDSQMHGEHYTAFLLAEPQSAGCVRLAEVAGGAFAHNAANRFLNREDFSGRDLFEEARPLLDLEGGTVECG
jgi:hypothetical protein